MFCHRIGWTNKRKERNWMIHLEEKNSVFYYEKLLQMACGTAVSRVVHLYILSYMLSTKPITQEILDFVVGTQLKMRTMSIVHLVARKKVEWNPYIKHRYSLTPIRVRPKFFPQLIFSTFSSVEYFWNHFTRSEVNPILKTGCIFPKSCPVMSVCHGLVFFWSDNFGG